MEDMAARLESMVEELTDMAIDALRRATSGDPDSAEAGEAIAMERRIVKARRALERSIVALRGSTAGGHEPLDDGAA